MHNPSNQMRTQKNLQILISVIIRESRKRGVFLETMRKLTSNLDLLIVRAFEYDSSPAFFRCCPWSGKMGGLEHLDACCDQTIIITIEIIGYQAKMIPAVWRSLGLMHQFQDGIAKLQIHNLLHSWIRDIMFKIRFKAKVFLVETDGRHSIFYSKSNVINSLEHGFHS